MWIFRVLVIVSVFILPVHGGLFDFLGHGLKSFLGMFTSAASHHQTLVSASS